MGDVFKEQIVKRQSTAKDMAIRVCLVIAVIIVFFISFGIIVEFVVLITAAAAFGAYYLISFSKVEYEYIFTNGELDIDAIYNRSRRKRMFSSHVNDFEIMAHIDDQNHAGAFKSAEVVKDFSSGTSGADTYVFLINKNSKRMKVIIEPNDKMLSAISGIMSRTKLHTKK